MTEDGRPDSRDIYLGQRIDQLGARIEAGLDRVVDRLSETTGRLYARLDDLPEQIRQAVEQAVEPLVPLPVPWWQQFPGNMLVAMMGMFVFVVGLGAVAAWGILPDGMLDRLLEIAASYVETGEIVGDAVASPSP